MMLHRHFENLPGKEKTADISPVEKTTPAQEQSAEPKKPARSSRKGRTKAE